MDRNTLLNTEQAAEFLGVQTRTLEKWRYEGRGPIFCSMSRRLVRYRRCDLDDFVEGQLRRSTSDIPAKAK